MTKQDPLADALARLRAEVRLTEESLARRTAEGASLHERLALAGDVYTARRAAAAAPEHRPGAGLQALADLLGLPAEKPTPGDPAEPALEADEWAALDARIAAEKAAPEPGAAQAVAGPQNGAERQPTADEAAFLAALQNNDNEENDQ